MMSFLFMIEGIKQVRLILLAKYQREVKGLEWLLAKYSLTSGESSSKI